MRRAAWVAAALVALSAVGGATAVLADEGATAAGSPQETATQAAPAATAPVERRDLAITEEFDGTLSYDDERNLTAQRAGTVTRLPDVGEVVRNGEQLLRIDEQPMVLLDGGLPAYRDLSYGASGRDVAQLDRALAAAGHLDEDDADDDFDDATWEAVLDLQDELGMDEDGTLELAEYTFAPSAVRVAGHPVDRGGAAAPGQPVLTVSRTRRAITVQLDPADRDLVASGQAVEVVLPTGETTAGTVAEVGTTITQDSEGGDVLDLTITVDDPSAVKRFDQAPVTVEVATTVAEDALTVPVDAIVGTAGGAHAVDRVRDDRVTRVPVELGAWGDANVEVTGDLREGDDVVVPG